MNQRNDIKDAKQTCKRLYHEYTAITGSGNKPIPPEQEVRQRPNQQFESHEEYSCWLDSSGWTYYVPATMHSSSSPSSLWQPSDSWWSTRNWDSSSWSEQCFEKKTFQTRHFACRKFNLLAIDGGVNSTPSAHTFSHLLETHPNRESLMASLNKNQKINLFSEESKELIGSMGNTEYFELCEITSKIQCPDCSLFFGNRALYFARAANACSLRKEIDSWTKDRYDVLSITKFIIKKNPSHGARSDRPKGSESATPEKEVQHHIRKIPNRLSLSRLIDYKSGGMRTSLVHTTRSQKRTTPTMRREGKEVKTNSRGDSY